MVKQKSKIHHKLQILIISCIIFFTGFFVRGLFYTNNIPEKKIKIEITPTTKAYSVNKVIDGDTVVLKGGEKLRFLGVDAPELGEKWSFDSKSYVEEMVLGKKIFVEFGTKSYDVYGRMLGYVWIDRKMLSELLLEEGLAKLYILESDNIQYTQRLKKAEQWAKEHHNGIWFENWIR